MAGVDIPEETVQKMLALVSYLNDDLWPYGSGRFPDSNRYQLAKAKRLAKEIRHEIQEVTE